MTGPTRHERPYVKQVAEHHQMGSGSEPSNGLPFVPARSHSGTVPLTTHHIRAKAVSVLSAAQREKEAHAAARGRFIRKATYWSTFVTYTVHTLRLDK